ncbi:MAG: lipase family protein [Rhizobiaceae bacterium]
MFRRFLFLAFALVLSACVSGENDEGVLQSAVLAKPVQVETPAQTNTNEDGETASEFAFEQQAIVPTFVPNPKETYLINGLASSVNSIGYGFTNLSRKIPGSTLHNYASFIESSTLIRSEVTRELKNAHRKNPNVEINLIGISFGANIVTLIAADLDRAKIPVNYLATMEGPAMVPIRDNVRVADNFSCTNLDCFRTKSRLSWGNKTTRFAAFKIKSSHIPLANHPDVHRRILSQINTAPATGLGLQ